MAERKQEKDEQVPPEKAAREAVQETTPAEEAEAFPVERLVTDATDLVGYEPHEVAGALHGVNRKNLTVEEAKAAVKAWLESPVKEG